MDLKFQANALRLLAQILDYKNATVPFLPCHSQKAPFDDSIAIAQPFERSTPESQGISSALLCDFLSRLARDRSLCMHTVLVLRNGKIIAEASFGAYQANLWHIAYSLSKSVTGMAIGMLIDEGRLTLEDRVTDLFSGRVSALMQIVQGGITVRHLLNMTSGVTFNELASVVEEDWVRGFLESVLKSVPGKNFSYNSMNSYMLSAIVREVTGRGLTDYLRPRLFEPLGITQLYWEKCPMGIEKGGWGLYMRPEDMAKLGQLYLQGGVWNGKRIISRRWIADSCSEKIQVPESFGDFNYGYQLWVGRKQHCFLFNGMLGQNVIGFPDTGIVIAATAGNTELFQQGGFFDAIKKYFGPDFHPGAALKENPTDYRRLRRLQASFHKNEPAHTLQAKQCSAFNRKYYDIEGGKSLGLLPILLQTMQNNYTKGLSGVGFELKQNSLWITFNEHDQTYALPAGFAQPRYADLDINGEAYRVGSLARLAPDEDGNPVLTVRFSFIETASSRIIKFVFHGDEITLKCFEIPGRAYLMMALSAVVKGIFEKKLIEALLFRADADYLDYKMSRVFDPVVSGRLSKDKKYPSLTKTSSKAK